MAADVQKMFEFGSFLKTSEKCWRRTISANAGLQVHQRKNLCNREVDKRSFQGSPGCSQSWCSLSSLPDLLESSRHHFPWIQRPFLVLNLAQEGKRREDDCSPREELDLHVFAPPSLESSEILLLLSRSSPFGVLQVGGEYVDRSGTLAALKRTEKVNSLGLLMS